MIIWPTKKAPARSFVPASSKRGRQIAAANPAKDQIGETIRTPAESFVAQREQRKQTRLIAKSENMVVVDELTPYKPK